MRALLSIPRMNEWSSLTMSTGMPAPSWRGRYATLHVGTYRRVPHLTEGGRPVVLVACGAGGGADGTGDRDPRRGGPGSRPALPSSWNRGTVCLLYVPPVNLSDDHVP